MIGMAVALQLRCSISGCLFCLGFLLKKNRGKAAKTRERSARCFIWRRYCRVYGGARPVHRYLLISPLGKRFRRVAGNLETCRSSSKPVKAKPRRRKQREPLLPALLLTVNRT